MMNPNEVELPLVEDNPNNVKLTTRALKKHKLANDAFVVKDGVKALKCIFATGVYARRIIDDRPKVVFLDLRLLKVKG